MSIFPIRYRLNRWLRQHHVHPADFLVFLGVVFCFLLWLFALLIGALS